MVAIYRLTATHRLLLEALLEREGESLTREELRTAITKPKPEPALRTIDVQICQLRSALGPKSDIYIDTIIGQGYVLRRKGRTYE